MMKRQSGWKMILFFFCYEEDGFVKVIEKK